MPTKKEPTKELTVLERLNKIQTELKAPKNLFNSFGKYKYRNAEGILEALKPMLKELACIVIITDQIIAVGDRIYVQASVSFSCNFGNPIVVQASARESESKKGMDEAQITGAASSYARKYALNGLFLLDDTKDADTQDNTGINKKEVGLTKQLAKEIDEMKTVEELRAFYAKNKGKGKEFDAYVMEKSKALKDLSL